MEKRNHRKSDKKRKSAKNVDSFEKHFELKREKRTYQPKKVFGKEYAKDVLAGKKVTGGKKKRRAKR